MDERRTALIFKAFCDENRIRILRLLRGGEKCACRLLEELSIRYTVVYQKDSIYPGGYVTGLDHMEGSKYDLEKAIVVQVYVSSRED